VVLGHSIAAAFGAMLPTPSGNQAGSEYRRGGRRFWDCARPSGDSGMVWTLGLSQDAGEVGCDMSHSHTGSS